MEEFVIIGGGLAGLCAAIRLAELGASPLLIEAGHYPSHKVCGEFFSPESIPYLQQWNIAPLLLSSARFHTSSQSFEFTFPRPAGSLSHFLVDAQLAEHAKAKGAVFYTDTKVQHLSPKSQSQPFHAITLANGTIIQAGQLLIATGRLPGMQSLAFQPAYVGIKAHFEQIPMEQCLEMFAFPGAYLGIEPIENGRYNVACLAKKEEIDQFQSPALFMQFLMQQNPLLRSYLSQGKMIFTDWMHAFIPHFGIKQTPHWADTYFIGDAAGTIPPACGEGLSLAISSGCLAAEYAIKGKFKEYKKAWLKNFRSPIYWGKGLHYILLKPPLIGTGLSLVRNIPSLAHLVFSLTRQPLHSHV